MGLSSLLWVTCRECGELNKVPTGKSHKVQGSKKKLVYDVNTKHASAMVHAGMGASSLNRYFASINLPPLSITTTKNREREFGPKIESLAKSSCEESIITEKELFGDVGNTLEPRNLTASFDMGWQCKGRGKRYASRSGHAVVIGKESGKILNYATRVSNCKQCEVNKDVLHDCRMNWGGSSKAMEGDSAVELIKKTKGDTYQIGTIINDEDSTTMARITAEVDHTVVKNSDVNHCKKTVGNELWTLKLGTYKKLISSQVINYIKKNYSYAITQNKDNPENTKLALMNCVPHMYNDHLGCGDWCTHRDDPGRLYRCLPYGKPFSDLQLRVELEKIFSKQASNASRLCPNASSNSNESFNMTVAAKAPKTKHYSKSESIDYRVAAAVCQKNKGESYLSTVYQNSGLSPGTATVKHAHSMDKITEKRRLRQGSKKFKRRRLDLKQSNYAASGQKELREGVTYLSSVALTSINEAATTSIPDIVVEPVVERIPVLDMEQFILVGFDLETTGLSDVCELTQVAASRFDGMDHFDQYILPVGSISSGAVRATGITKHNNRLFLRSRPVESADAHTILSSFADWIDHQGGKVVLIGHNVERFDSKHFWRTVTNISLVSRFCNLAGFVDTLPLLRSMYPEAKNHKQETMFALIVGGTYDAHNAMGDVSAVIKIMQKLSVSTPSLCSHSLTMQYIEKKHKYLEMKNTNLVSLHTLEGTGVVTKSMSQKIAGSGLNLGHLKLAFERDETNGIRQLFTEKFFNQKARVTASKSIIVKVNQYLATHK